MAKITASKPVDEVSITSRRANEVIVKIAGMHCKVKVLSKGTPITTEGRQLYPRAISVSSTLLFQKVKMFCNILIFSSYKQY